VRSWWLLEAHPTSGRFETLHHAHRRVSGPKQRGPRLIYAKARSNPASAELPELSLRFPSILIGRVKGEGELLFGPAAFGPAQLDSDLALGQGVADAPPIDESNAIGRRTLGAGRTDDDAYTKNEVRWARRHLHELAPGGDVDGPGHALHEHLEIGPIGGGEAVGGTLQSVLQEGALSGAKSEPGGRWLGGRALGHARIHLSRQNQEPEHPVVLAGAGESCQRPDPEPGRVSASHLCLPASSGPLRPLA